MSNAFGTPADETIFGAFGEFEPVNMTDEEWAEYDRQLAEDIARADEEAENSDWSWDL